ncbi:ATP-binding cassette domain-containing protein [Pontibacter diazotrophicus]|uniref:ATP-binding cassette domain-containing protein n=1 Tax=Pontibacter diazotrophicus TaxID=1400979 RepID=A0A3D8LCJ5_9BACT|nr:ATP-binding cassette domain-containing protein [Pontibacter diazotrophicus]RDV15137.1 ATP-binding cassette domain-containing protein [Pontibacter diazotrophicus]
MVKHTLEVDSVLYSFGERKLLSDVYLNCGTGEIVGLLGRNGCGKTTLLKIIFGTKHTDNKHISIDGKVYTKPYLHAGLLAYLPQQGFLPKNIPLSEILNLYLPQQDKRNIVKQNIRIKQHLTKRADELSKGELRYFELLLLLQLDVKFLLLDEPFSGVEPLYVEQIEELLQSHLPTKGFLITDHDYRAVLRVSQRLILITDGACRPITHTDELIDWGYMPASTATES